MAEALPRSPDDNNRGGCTAGAWESIAAYSIANPAARSRSSRLDALCRRRVPLWTSSSTTPLGLALTVMELHDEAIVLRSWREADARAVYEACQDAEIQRWIPVIPRPYTADHARAFVTAVSEAGGHHLAIVEHGQVVGSIALRVKANSTGAIGYWCASGARGRGVTTRALRTLCRYALDELRLERLELITDLDNRAYLASDRSVAAE